MKSDRRKSSDIIRNGANIVQLFGLIENIIERKNGCKQCIVCCCHDGNIKITRTEFDLIKNQLPSKSSSIIKSACVFLDKIGNCTVYEIRPVECRIYNVLDSRIDCIRQQEGNAEKAAIRELVYLALRTIDTEVKTLNEWITELGNE